MTRSRILGQTEHIYEGDGPQSVQKICAIKKKKKEECLKGK